MNKDMFDLESGNYKIIKNKYQKIPDNEDDFDFSIRKSDKIKNTIWKTYDDLSGGIYIKDEDNNIKELVEYDQELKEVHYLFGNKSWHGIDELMRCEEKILRDFPELSIDSKTEIRNCSLFEKEKEPEIIKVLVKEPGNNAKEQEIKNDNVEVVGIIESFPEEINLSDYSEEFNDYTKKTGRSLIALYNPIELEIKDEKSINMTLNDNLKPILYGNVVFTVQEKDSNKFSTLTEEEIKVLKNFSFLYSIEVQEEKSHELRIESKGRGYEGR